MIKDKNEWKITSLITIDSSSYTSADAMAVENKFNNIGYALLNNKKIKDAIEVFKLNVTLFPKSWNVYDSLGEAYANNGDTKDAVKNYEQSIQLNPQNDNGKKMLNKLKTK
jgi:Flp pilus assembly protein TadD